MTIQSGNITVSYDADSVVWTDDAGMAHDYRGEQILEAIVFHNFGKGALGMKCPTKRRKIYGGENKDKMELAKGIFKIS